jgi:hypothetical protein
MLGVYILQKKSRIIALKNAINLIINMGIQTLQYILSVTIEINFSLWLGLSPRTSIQFGPKLNTNGFCGKFNLINIFLKLIFANRF